MTTVTDTAALVEGIDYEDQPVHIQIPDLPDGQVLAYCGASIRGGTKLPFKEVTESAWCRDCEAIWEAGP